MNVLVIMSSDDAQQGQATALIEMPENMTDDQVFVRWLQAKSNYWANQSEAACMEAEYAWGVREVQKL